MVIGANVHFNVSILNFNFQISLLINNLDMIEDVEITSADVPHQELAQFKQALIQKNLYQIKFENKNQWVNWQDLLLNEVKKNYTGEITRGESNLCLCFGTSYKDLENYKTNHENWSQTIKQELLIGAGCGSCLKLFEDYIAEETKPKMICFCHEVYETEIKDALNKYGFDMQKITAMTSAGGSCGRCVAEIKQIYLNLNPKRYKGKARADWFLSINQHLEEFLLNYPQENLKIELSKIENEKIYLKGHVTNEDDFLYHFQDFLNKNLDNDFIVFFEI